MRHDFSDQIQVRYPHPDGEKYDTWVSGEEVMQRLKTRSREELIQSFSQLNLRQAREAGKREIESGKKKVRRNLMDRLADTVEDNIGGNIFGDTFADKIRGVDSTVDPHDAEKKQWQSRLHDEAFRMVVLEIAWANIGDTLPGEATEAPDDWV